MDGLIVAFEQGDGMHLFHHILRSGTRTGQVAGRDVQGVHHTQQGDVQIFVTLPPLFRPFRQAASHNFFQGEGTSVAHCLSNGWGRCREVLLLHLDQTLHRGVAPDEKGRHAGQRFEEAAAKAVDVRTEGHLAGPDKLLGSHVGRGAKNRANTGNVGREIFKEVGLRELFQGVV